MQMTCRLMSVFFFLQISKLTRVVKYLLTLFLLTKEEICVSKNYNKNTDVFIFLTSECIFSNSV